jgi:predicted alpha/beta superfamily hydrolase
LIQSGQHHWAVGENNLVLMSEQDHRVSYPFFFSSDEGTFSKLVELPSKILGRTHRLKVYVPPGYYENTESRYPVAYMQDGQNLFFPDEAFMGQDWGVSGTKSVLRSMGAADEFIVVGIYSGDRMHEYTKPGYEAYVRSLVEEVVPQADLHLRTKVGRRFRIMWGSSLGGVVSFYGPWQHPDVFAAGICMSSTFSFKDDLTERVLSEKPRDVAYYLDSGWPGDNYETTLNMAMALVSRGWVYGRNLFHFAFPNARHSESDWGTRLHLPVQLMTGSVARASRMTHQVLKDTI